MTFSLCIDSRYTSGSKSLSSIIGKYKVYGNFTYDVFIPHYMMPVLFQQFCMVLKYLDIINPSNFEEKNTKKEH